MALIFVELDLVDDVNFILANGECYAALLGSLIVSPNVTSVTAVTDCCRPVCACKAPSAIAAGRKKPQARGGIGAYPLFGFQFGYSDAKPSNSQPKLKLTAPTADPPQPPVDAPPSASPPPPPANDAE
ncbi:MAG TPA: hypothetical protein VHY37_00455 [Tepidisphaeraceae bacterium]|jgi:hypothetical protein|nr:hypothetical protein [Tepidisphaeraceae bacterium]